MSYDLFPTDSIFGQNSFGERELQRGFGTIISVETVPAEKVQKRSGKGKRSQEDEHGAVRSPGRIHILGIENIDLMAPCKLLAEEYDLVSVEPLDKKTLQLACTTLPVDVISINLDPSSKCAKSRQADALHGCTFIWHINLDAGCLGNHGAVASGRLEAAVSTMTAVLAAKIPRHMLVLSSGHGTRPGTSPGQLVSMATLLGMKRQHAVLAVSDNPAALLKQAMLRRLRGVAVVHED